jgi:hypothetical protein
VVELTLGNLPRVSNHDRVKQFILMTAAELSPGMVDHGVG